MATALYRINCGSSEAFTDDQGLVWRADHLVSVPEEDADPLPAPVDWYCIGGKSGMREPDLPLYPTGLAGLLRCECHGLSAYRFALPAGTYTVRLIVATTFEMLASLNNRFTVTLNGAPLAEEIQPGAIAQGFGRAGVVTIRGVAVAGEGLEIGFPQGGAVYGLEILSGSPKEALTVECTALAPTSVAAPDDDASTVQHRPRILFVGHSGLFFWAIPESVARMVALNQPTLRLQIDAWYAGGKGVRFFLEAPEVRQRLDENQYDYVVLVDSSWGPIDSPDEFTEYMPQLIDLVTAHGAVPILYAYSAPMRHTPEERQRLLALYVEMGRRMSVPVVPFAAAILDVLANDPAQNYHNPDRHHLGMMGGYLDACVWYRALTGNSAVTLTEQTILAGHVQVPADKARFLAEVSDRICTEYGVGASAEDAILAPYLTVECS